MDLDAVADELYGLPPGDFTEVRNERAKEARAAGDRELAERIRRLRRPTLAAWASNLLVREQPEETGPLLRLGEALRTAHRDLDGEQLRELSAKQRQVVSALGRQAGQLTAQAGQRISEDVRHEVEETLHAALADPRAAQEWARGRLTRPLTAPTGFAAITEAPGTAAPEAPPTPRRRGKGKVADLDAERARRRERREQLERAQRQAEEARRALQEREDELAAARGGERDAEDRRRQAEARVTDLTDRLRQAETEQRRARDAAHDAREHAREADRAVREARRHAEDATSHAERLADQVER